MTSKSKCSVGILRKTFSEAKKLNNEINQNTLTLYKLSYEQEQKSIT